MWFLKEDIKVLNVGLVGAKNHISKRVEIMTQMLRFKLLNYIRLHFVTQIYRGMHYIFFKSTLSTKWSILFNVLILSIH